MVRWMVTVRKMLMLFMLFDDVPLAADMWGVEAAEG
jgi:hypothetical protein